MVMGHGRIAPGTSPTHHGRRVNTNLSIVEEAAAEGKAEAEAEAEATLSLNI